MAATLRKVPENGAENLYEAIQLFIIMWQVMCLEQTPNPYAFSVGNADLSSNLTEAKKIQAET